MGSLRTCGVGENRAWIVGIAYPGHVVRLSLQLYDNSRTLELVKAAARRTRRPGPAPGRARPVADRAGASPGGARDLRRPPPAGRMRSPRLDATPATSSRGRVAAAFAAGGAPLRVARRWWVANMRVWWRHSVGDRDSRPRKWDRSFRPSGAGVAARSSSGSACCSARGGAIVGDGLAERAARAPAQGALHGDVSTRCSPRVRARPGETITGTAFASTRSPGPVRDRRAARPASRPGPPRAGAAAGVPLPALPGSTLLRATGIGQVAERIRGRPAARVPSRERTSRRDTRQIGVPRRTAGPRGYPPAGYSTPLPHRSELQTQLNNARPHPARPPSSPSTAPGRGPSGRGGRNNPTGRWGRVSLGQL